MSGVTVSSLGGISDQFQEGGSDEFCDTLLWMYPAVLCSWLYRCIVDDLCFVDSVEVLINSHELTGAFSEVSNLNPYVPEEIIYVPSPNYHDCFWVYPG